MPVLGLMKSGAFGCFCWSIKKKKSAKVLWNEVIDSM